MAYIRQKSEELTGYQNGLPWSATVDLECDFVMVYRTDETMTERIRQYHEKGYVVHAMTGISWGQYQSYLRGEWDGREHWDEGQKERSGKPVIHGPTTPYMVPTIAFSDFLIDKLKKVVDAGVDVIHVEEPEFWDRSGYSDAFKREYEIFYREPWRPQHENVDVHYKSARLKAYLYTRTINRVSAALKEYAKATYARDLRFYVPTHSLLNYSQWKIVSPETALIDIPTVDGYVAQVWTGTSRTPNVYNGVCRERIFETAYLEYGAMQELTKGTGRRMWFLHDPIEDVPSFTWENYRYNYIKTAVASLLHPHVWHYEICPWPDRVFDGVYPRYQPNIEKRDETSYAAEGAKPIPPDYATLLSGMFQMFGDMEQEDICFEAEQGVGVLMSDSGMYQRTYPEGVTEGRSLNLWNMRQEREEVIEEYIERFKTEPALITDFMESMAFPAFFGLTMPLLKYGLPIRPVQLDNVKRYAGYLNDYRYLVLSYEYMKPESPDVNGALAAWVRQGGVLFYLGDGSDLYHGISSWWQSAGYENPAMHLFEMAELGRMPEDGSYAVGKGRIVVWNVLPAKICLFPELADRYRCLVRETFVEQGSCWEYRNDMTLHRGPYIISTVMEESCSSESKLFEGVYADMLENDYRIIHRKEIRSDESTILFDFSKIEKEHFRIIGTSARVLTAELKECSVVLRLKTADKIRAFTRVRLPEAAVDVKAVLAGKSTKETETAPIEAGAAGTESMPAGNNSQDAEIVPVTWEWDQETATLLLAYDSTAREVVVTVEIQSAGEQA